MKTVVVNELKAKLSLFLKCVQAGEEVLVLNRGKPVARIIPVELADDEEESAWEMELIRTGRMRPALKKIPEDFWIRELPEDPDGLVLKALIEEAK